MKLQLPSSISSSQDFTALQLEVREYAKWYSHFSVKKRVDAEITAEQPTVTPAAAELINAWAAEHPISTQSLDDLIMAMEDFRDSAPTVAITLAAPPTGDVKKSLVTWCRANIAPDILVSFQFNSTLLGGMVVRYGSHIYDWSFRCQILAARQKFPEILRRV